ncbi:MAG TPA: hypothetical protein VF606_00540 [Geminicoccaceae bacterium]
MNDFRSRVILAAATAALLLPASGAIARNIKAKPEPALCIAARAQNQILPGCPRPENLRDTPAAASPAPPPAAEPRDAGRGSARSPRS